jgi:hypothetical protein
MSIGDLAMGRRYSFVVVILGPKPGVNRAQGVLCVCPPACVLRAMPIALDAWFFSYGQGVAPGVWKAVLQQIDSAGTAPRMPPVPPQAYFSSALNP